MIFITGDVHGQIDIGKITKRKWPEQKNLSRDDYLIVLGDFGLYWEDEYDETFLYLMDFYQSRNYTVLWIDGNHENHDWIDELPVTEWNGGKVHRDRNVIHLMRGQVFQIDGLKFFTMGGARSVDKEMRVEGISWWKREELNYEEQEEVFKNLEASNWHVDYILTHAAPKGVLLPMFPGRPYAGDSTTEKFLDSISTDIKYRHWFFGHYHEDKDMGKFSAMYNRILRIEG